VLGDGMGQTNVVGARELKALIFYTINLLLYEKRSHCVFELLFGGLETTYAVHLRLIGKLVVDFLLVIIELFSLGAIMCFTEFTDASNEDNAGISKHRLSPYTAITISTIKLYSSRFQLRQELLLKCINIIAIYTTC